MLEWCLPESPAESQSLQAELLWGIQLDELYQGRRMYTHSGYVGLFESAGLPKPAVIDLLSGATLFVASGPPERGPSAASRAPGRLGPPI